MRFFRYSVIFIVIFLASLPAWAQEETPPPVPVTDEQVQVLLVEAQQALAEAQRANDLAFNLLGLFEATSGAVGIILGIIVPVVAVVAGLFGFSQLASAKEELKKSRESFEEDMKVVMNKYFEDFTVSNNKIQANQNVLLQSAIAKQQKQGANANLALALLPSAERQYKAQDYLGAIETYERALELDGANPIIHYRLGYVFTQKGDLNEAKRHIEQALELDAQSPQAMAALAYVCRRMGDKLNQPHQSVERNKMYNESERYFLDVLPKYPKLLDEDGESWWGAFGGLYKRREQYKEAIEIYERATHATKSSSYPFSNLAQLYMITGEHEKMVRTYQRVERLAQAEVYAEVENYWAYADLITSRVAQGKFDDAWKVLDEALPTAPPDATYPLELLLSTLKDIQKYLPDYAERINRFVSHIQGFLDARKPQIQ